MRKFFGGAAEDLCEPAASLLMRDVHEVTVAKNICQAVWAGVSLRHFLRCPKVLPPGHKCQRQENGDGSYYQNCYQNFSSHAPELSVAHSSIQIISACASLRLQNFKGAGYQRIETSFNIGLLVK